MPTLALSQSALPHKNWWVFDSGSGRHICHQKELFHKFKPLAIEQMITTGAGNFNVEGVGSVVLKIKTPQGPGTLKIEGPLYVPKFMVNIVSMDKIKDQMLIWDHSENWITRWDAHRAPVAKAWNQYNQNFIAREAIYSLQTSILKDLPETVSIDLVHESTLALKNSSLRKVSSADVVIWHRRLGHPCSSTVKKLKDAAVGIRVTGSIEGKYESYLLAKSKRIVYRIPVDRGSSCWNRMHVDLIVFSKAWNGDMYALHAYDA